MADLDVSQLSMVQKSGWDNYHPSKMYDERDALQMINERYRDDQREYLKHPFEKQWLVNIAFFQGHQHIVWDDTLRSLREPKTPSWRVRLVANEIWSKVLRSIALMTNTRIPWRVIPSSTDKEDIDAARVGQIMLEHYERTLGFDELRIEAEYWAQCAGTCFFKVFWDPEGGVAEKIYFDEQNRPIPDFVLSSNPELKRKLDMAGSYKTFPTGAAKIEVVNPFRVMVDPFTSRHRDLTWILESKDTPMTEIWNQFPDKAENVAPGRSHNLSSWYERRLLHINGIFGFSGYVEGRKYGEDSALMKELFVAPYNKGRGRKFEHGRHIIVAGDQVLLDGPNKYHEMGYPDHGFPYVKIGYSMIPGRYWDGSQVELHIPLQRANNLVRSKVIESFKLMGMPKWVAPYKSDLKQSAINTRPGEVIEYDHMATGGIPPTMITPPNLPPYYMDILNRNSDTMGELASQPGTVKGEAPPGRASGVAVKALQDKALLPLNPLIRMREIAKGKIGSMLLRITGENVTESQILKVYGRDGAFEVRKFKGADLRGNYDCILPEGSLMPKTRAEVEELILNLAQAGALNPLQSKKDKAAIIRATRFGEDEEWFRAEEADRRRAKVENDMMNNMQNPQIPQVKDFDDHGVHVEEHNLFRKSDMYERLPDQLKKAIDAHVNRHKQYIEREQQKQMQMQMAMRGGQGQKGKPSAPASRGGAPQSQGLMP